MTKVLHVTSAFNPMGGTISKLRLLVQESSCKHLIYFYCYKNNIEKAKGEDNFYQEKGIKTFYAPYGINILRHAFYIHRILIDEEVDVVNFYFHVETSVLLILKILNPKVKYVRTFEGYECPSGIKVRLIKLALRNCDSCIFISNYIKRCYEKLFPLLKVADTEIIYNCPIHVSEPSIAQSDREMVTYVGGLNINKNVPLLIKMMNSVVNKYHRTDIILSIVGDGADRKDIENLIAQYNIANQVKLLGFQNNIPDFLDNTAVYVHSATNEGFGISVVEAMCMKCPCLVANASALPELIDEKSGFILPTDNPDLWAEKLIFLMDNTSSRVTMGDAAYLRAKSVFSKHSFVNHYDQLISRLSSK